MFRSRNTQILFPFFKNSDKIISEGVGGGGRTPQEKVQKDFYTLPCRDGNLF